MATYLILNLIFLLLLSPLLLTRPKLSIQLAFTMFAILFIMTAIFDSLIIALSVVAYDPAKYLGVFVGLAPIEDFFYLIAAIIIVPSVWCIVEKYEKKKEDQFCEATT